MDNNILSEFTAFIEKSAVAMGDNTLATTQAPAGQSAPRVATTDEVNNSISPGLGNPSHGGAMGVPKAVTAPGKPLQKAKF